MNEPKQKNTLIVFMIVAAFALGFIANLLLGNESGSENIRIVVNGDLHLDKELVDEIVLEKATVEPVSTLTADEEAEAIKEYQDGKQATGTSTATIPVAVPTPSPVP